MKMRRLNSEENEEIANNKNKKTGDKANQSNVYRGKLFGTEPVKESRGEVVCQVALARLRATLLALKQHKRKIVITIDDNGLLVQDEKQEEEIFKYNAEQISFVARDPYDTRTFGCIVCPTTSAENDATMQHIYIGIRVDRQTDHLLANLRKMLQHHLEKKNISETSEIESKTSNSVIESVKDGTSLPENDTIDNKIKVENLLDLNDISNMAAISLNDSLPMYSSNEFNNQSNSNDTWATFNEAVNPVSNSPNIVQRPQSNSSSHHGYSPVKITPSTFVGAYQLPNTLDRTASLEANFNILNIASSSQLPQINQRYSVQIGVPSANQLENTKANYNQALISPPIAKNTHLLNQPSIRPNMISNQLLNTSQTAYQPYVAANQYGGSMGFNSNSVLQSQFPKSEKSNNGGAGGHNAATAIPASAVSQFPQPYFNQQYNQIGFNQLSTTSRSQVTGLLNAMPGVSLQGNGIGKFSDNNHLGHSLNSQGFSFDNSTDNLNFSWPGAMISREKQSFPQEENLNTVCLNEFQLWNATQSPHHQNTNLRANNPFK